MTAPAGPGGPAPDGDQHGRRRVVRVLPDVAAIDKEFDYLVPDGVEVELGDVVRVELNGRRVGGWVVALDVEPPADVVLRPLARVSGRGPAPELIDLARWAAWRWVGRPAAFLRTASPPGVVAARPPAPTHPSPVAADPLVADALVQRRGVLRLGPASDRFPLVLAAATAPSPVPDGWTLVLCPSVAEAAALGARLRRAGVPTAVVASDRPGAAAAREWARAAAGSVVVGARAAAWAPVAPLGRVVMLDEHDEVYQQEQSPTWHARDVVAARAERAGAPCLLVSPCPSLEALAWGTLVAPSRAEERRGWPTVSVVDQRTIDPLLGPLFSPALVEALRGPGRVVCVLNRTGRSRLLACAACGTLVRCEACDAAVAQLEPGTLTCARCGTERPAVCLVCGGTKLKNLRLGVSRAREELEALAGEPVGEVVGGPGGDRAGASGAAARISIGTEAVLHRLPSAAVVAFLDFDQELLAPRYRAAEEALGLLARAARVVRGRAEHGRVLVQTRTPDHPVLKSAQQADPGRLVASERPLREVLRLPPAWALAEVSGAAAPAFVAALGQPPGIEVQGPVDGTWRVRAADHVTLCGALGAVPRPPGRLRLAVDPLRS